MTPPLDLHLWKASRRWIAGVWSAENRAAARLPEVPEASTHALPGEGIASEPRTASRPTKGSKGNAAAPSPGSLNTSTVSRTRIYDESGRLLGPFATLHLSEHECALLWWAIYVAYGNEYRAMDLGWKFRDAVGEDRYATIIEAGSEIGREKHPVHPADDLKEGQ